MLVLSDGMRRVQVRCADKDVRLEPFALEPVIEKFPEVRSSIQLVEVLAVLFGPDKIRSAKPVWSVETMRHRDALLALDWRLAGHSYRQIAVAIHGEDAVDSDWNDPDSTMKNRTIRSVKRGLRMMNGGYKSLLK